MSLVWQSTEESEKSWNRPNAGRIQQSEGNKDNMIVRLPHKTYPDLAAGFVASILLAVLIIVGVSLLW